MNKRPLAVALSALGAVLLEACVYSDLGDHCSFSASQSLAMADSNSLGVVIGAPANRVTDAPFAMLYCAAT